MLPESAFTHDYSVWEPGTTITLCNVPWDNNYRDIVKFSSAKAIDNYINSLRSEKIIIERLTVLPPNEPIRLPTPHNIVQHFNYIRVVNPAKVPGDKVFPFYYFIGNPVYIAGNTTQLNIQLDIWTTYGNYVHFGASYVRRGHVGIAQSVGNKDLNMLNAPEGLETGGEYEVVSQHRHDITNFFAKDGSIEPPMYVIYASANLRADPGTENNPKLKSSQGVTLGNGFDVMADVFIMEHAPFMRLCAKTQDAPWISQSIMSVIVIPNIDIDENETDPAGGKTWDKATLLNDPTCVAYVPSGSSLVSYDGIHVRKTFVKKLDMLNDVAKTFLDMLPARYRHLKKFATYPYSVIEVTLFNGSPLIVKPEQLDKNELKLLESVYPFPPSPRITYSVRDYNTRETGDVLDRGEYLDMSTGITNMPQLPITNNSYLAYMASNKNSISYQYSSADWSQQKAMAGNQLGFDQAMNAVAASNESNQLNMGLMGTMNSIANDQAWGHQQVGMGTGAISTVGNLLTGNFGGAINSAVGTGASYLNYDIDKTARNAGNSAQTANMAAQQQIRNEQGAYMADSNKRYGDFAARGDYANAIAGIQAKTQDAKMLQPSVSGQLGGDMGMLYNFGWKINVKSKMITLNAVYTIGDYWLRYGYEVDRFVNIPDDLQTMRKFTYWQTMATYITGNISEMFKNVIRGIFEKGVTVWRDPNDIGSNPRTTTNEPITATYF